MLDASAAAGGEPAAVADGEVWPVAAEAWALTVAGAAAWAVAAAATEGSCEPLKPPTIKATPTANAPTAAALIQTGWLRNAKLLTQ